MGQANEEPPDSEIFQKNITINSNSAILRDMS